MESAELSHDSHDSTDRVPTMWNGTEAAERPSRGAALALFPTAERLAVPSVVARKLVDRVDRDDREPVTTVRPRVVGPVLFPPGPRQVTPRSNVNVTARGTVVGKASTAIDPEVARVRERAEAVAAARPTIPRVVAAAPEVVALAETQLASPVVDAAMMDPSVAPVIEPPVADAPSPARSRSRARKPQRRTRARNVAANELASAAPVASSLAPTLAPTLPAQPIFGSGMLKAHSRSRTQVVAHLPSPTGVALASGTLSTFGSGVLKQRGGNRAWLFVLLGVAALVAVYLATGFGAS